MSQQKLNKHREVAGRAHRFSLTRLAFVRLALLGRFAAPAVMLALAPQAALAQAVQTYRISPGSLGQALSEFAAAAGVSLSSDSTLTRSLSSAGLSGQYSVDAGFAKLLAGSGLEAVRQGNGTYILRRPPVAANVLPEVRVVGEHAEENAWGPVHGYVATRSATGTKTDTPILETPQSVSVVAADEMQARGVSNIKEAVGYTAGVTPSVSFDLREDLTTFRGFPFDWASFYLDGLAMPSTTYAVSTSEPFGMERIEVLRGPASMLYGQSSSGGILNMVSKRPLDGGVREVQLQAGSHNRRQLAFDLGGAASADRDWNYRVVGLARRSDTEIDFVEDNRVYLAPSLSWRPSAATSLVLLANYMYDDLGRSGGTSAFLPASGILLPNPNGKIARNTYGGEPGFDFYKKKQVSLGYEFRHAFDDTWQFTQNARWRTVNVDYQTAYGLGLSPADPSQRTLQRAAFGSFGETRALSVDNQLQATWESAGVRHTTLLGIDYRDFSVDEVRYFGPGAPIDIFAPVYGAPFALPATPDTSRAVKVEQLGFYVQDQARFARHWLLTLGARHDTAKHDVDDRIGAFDNRLTERKTTGRAGLSYLFDNGMAPYVSVATSFTPVLTPNYYGEPFKAMAGKQYEAGLKYQPPGGRSLYTAAVFELTQRNALTADPDQVNRPFGQVQTGEYRSRGIELEAKAQLTRSLNLLAAYTYLDAEITKSNDGNVGGTPKGIPSNTASVWADYTFRGDELQGFGFGLGVRYVGRRPSDDSAGAYMVPAFTVLDALISYELGDWRLALNASNLADKTIYDCWYARCWYGQGRSLLATVSLRW